MNHAIADQPRSVRCVLRDHECDGAHPCALHRTWATAQSSFHIVGTIFNRVIKEGIELSPDNPGHWGSQAVDLSPAQGAMVEFSMAEDGLYPIVTHAFNFVGRGALGLFQAGDGDPKN